MLVQIMLVQNMQVIRCVLLALLCSSGFLTCWLCMLKWYVSQRMRGSYLEVIELSHTVLFST